MAIHSKSGLLQKVAELIRSAGINGRTTAQNVRDMFTHVIDTLFHELGSINDFGPELTWDAGMSYHTTDYPFAISGLRVFRTKVNNNINHPPPNEPDVNGIYQDQYWIEVSPAPTSGIAEWAPGVYGNGLVIVYRNNQLWRLADTVSRPFDSIDFDNEEANGDWVGISGSPAGPGSGHTQNTDQFLDQGGTYEVSAQQAKEAYDVRHASNEDTFLDQGGPNEISAAQAKEAFDKAHDQNADTKLAEGTSDEVSAAELRALADAPPAAGGSPEHLRFNFFSDLDTISAVVTLKGPWQVSDFYFSSNMAGVTFQVKLDASSSYTAQATTTDLNSWSATNVTNPNTLSQLYLVADFGTNSGEGSASLVL